MVDDIDMEPEPVGDLTINQFIKSLVRQVHPFPVNRVRPSKIEFPPPVNRVRPILHLPFQNRLSKQYAAQYENCQTVKLCTSSDY